MPPRRGTSTGGASPSPTRGRGGGRPQAQALAQVQSQWPQRTQPQPQTQTRQQQRQQQHRVYEPGTRHMELIASVSRSSGLEKDGDALRDPKIQEEYRAFIQGKVDEYWKKYPLRSHRERAFGHEDADAEAEAEAGADADADARRNRKEMEENLLILFRKLREGLLSTQRRDAFALEVYETSLHLSVLFKSPVQTTSTLSHLFPDLYINIHPPSSHRSFLAPTLHAGTRTPTLSSQTPDARPATQPPTLRAPVPRAPAGSHSPPESEHKPPIPRSARASTLVLLLHHLAQSYPSQIAFHSQLRQLHPALQDVLRAPPCVLPAALASPGMPSASAPASASESVAGPQLEPAAPSPRSSTSAAPAPQSDTPAGLGLGSHAHDVKPASAEEWVLALARCLRARNYARLEALTRREAYAAFVLEQPQSNHLQSHGRRDDAPGTSSAPAHAPKPHGGSELDTAADAGSGRGQLDLDLQGSDSVRKAEAGALALEALGTLVETLLDKARGTTWAVLRSAYREVSLRAAVPGSGTTAEWLARSLVLRELGGGRVHAGHGDAPLGEVLIAERWLDGRRARGEARRKEGEGMEGRWVLVKA